MVENPVDVKRTRIWDGEDRGVGEYAVALEGSASKGEIRRKGEYSEVTRRFAKQLHPELDQ